MQVESAINTQSLKPQTDLIKRRYGDDKERIQRETSALYERAGVNPLAGVFVQLPWSALAAQDRLSVSLFLLLFCQSVQSCYFCYYSLLRLCKQDPHSCMSPPDGTALECLGRPGVPYRPSLPSALLPYMYMSPPKEAALECFGLPGVPWPPWTAYRPSLPSALCRSVHVYATLPTQASCTCSNV